MTNPTIRTSSQQGRTVRLFLCGDVMLGRGLDQIMRHPCDPALHEDYANSALDYVRLAENANGAIFRPVDNTYVWGAALQELAQARPDLRIVNLETSITRNEEYEPKGINYRMSPENADCLRAAKIDCCLLANNHVLDWRRAGLLDTIATLRSLHIKSAGAGRDRDAAATPAVFTIPGDRRVVVHSLASPASGTPSGWAAGTNIAGVNFLAHLSGPDADAVIDRIERQRRPGDVTVASIHWGPNWGYDISDQQQRFAQALIDRAGVSVVHGHSSHHAKALEVYRNRLILYGCGDFLNDYEGISGYESYRGDLSIMYFVDIDVADGTLIGLDLVPLQIKRFRLVRATAADIEWLRQTLERESSRFNPCELRTTGDHISLRIEGSRPV